jgi:hypothetical protein
MSIRSHVARGWLPIVLSGLMPTTPHRPERLAGATGCGAASAYCRVDRARRTSRRGLASARA